MFKFIAVIKRILTHRLYLFIYMTKLALKIFWRGVIHDRDKFHSVQIKAAMKANHLLKGLKFGTPEYKKVMNSVGFSVKYHQSRNSHHPEHYGSYGCMSLLDLIEMFLDWQAATNAYKNRMEGKMNEVLSIQKERYGLSDEVIKIFKTLYYENN